MSGLVSGLADQSNATTTKPLHLYRKVAIADRFDICRNNNYWGWY